MTKLLLSFRTGLVPANYIEILGRNDTKQNPPPDVVQIAWKVQLWDIYKLNVILRCIFNMFEKKVLLSKYSNTKILHRTIIWVFCLVVEYGKLYYIYMCRWNLPLKPSYSSELNFN